MPYGPATVAPEWTKEQELEALRGESEAIKEDLEQIEKRIQELESESES
jgi:predicted  nucleic acid-binding Zn-ribbon protein